MCRQRTVPRYRLLNHCLGFYPNGNISDLQPMSAGEDKGIGLSWHQPPSILEVIIIMRRFVVDNISAGWGRRVCAGVGNQSNQLVEHSPDDEEQHALPHQYAK
jgi:hypothetical protein